MYLKNQYNDNKKQSVLDVFKGEKNINNRQIHLEIHDTASDDNLNAERQMKYKGADIFAICVASNNRNSLNSINKWKTEIQQ